MTRPPLPDPCTLADIAAHLGIKKPGVVMKFKRSSTAPQPVHRKSREHLFRRSDVTAWIAQEAARKPKPRRRKPTVLTAEVRDRIVREYSLRESASEVARRLDLGIPSVIRALREAGLDTAAKKWRRSPITAVCPACQHSSHVADFTTTTQEN